MLDRSEGCAIVGSSYKPFLSCFLDVAGSRSYTPPPELIECAVGVAIDDFFQAQLIVSDWRINGTEQTEFRLFHFLLTDLFRESQLANALLKHLECSLRIWIQVRTQANEGRGQLASTCSIGASLLSDFLVQILLLE